jgi:hypothetical protein
MNEKITLGEHAPNAIEQVLAKLNAEMNDLEREYIRLCSASAQYPGVDNDYDQQVAEIEQSLRDLFNERLRITKDLGTELGQKAQSENTLGLKHEPHDEGQ